MQKICMSIQNTCHDISLDRRHAAKMNFMRAWYMSRERSACLQES